jgi:sortase A
MRLVRETDRLGRNAWEHGLRVRRRKTFRRRRAGLIFFSIFAILALTGAVSSALTGVPPEARGEIARVEAPALDRAPEAIDRQALERLAAEREARREAAEKKREAREEEKRRKQQEKREQEKRSAAREKEKESKAPPPPSDPTLYLTVPKLGIYSHTVRNDSSSWALDMGAMKLPTSAHPWQKNGNTYIAGHRIGWPGTQSYYQFYNLPSMVAGDAVYLTDTNGTVYEYRVSEVFAVSPSENWVTAPVAGRDMVTLQTCTESPTDWWTIGEDLMNSTPQSGRLIVRADRVT